MNDTHPKIDKKMRELFAAKTPGERMAIGCSMYDTSKRIVLAAIAREHPQASPRRIRRELFLRFYGSDFDPVQREKIAAWMEKHS